MRPAVFLDRDGTLMVERSDPASLGDPQQVALETRVIPALQQLQAAGYPLIVVTNQSGVGRGYFTEADVDRVHAHIRSEMA
ncbi:HAD-IIIA family hydrolase, partial [bacterium]|nr:HAD-IIIA family hydrolase [bacterium]